MPQLRIFFISAIALIAFIQAGYTHAQSAKFKLDPTHTAVVFSVTHLGMSHTYGRFNTVGGEFTYDKNAPATATFQVEIDANSIDSNSQQRDDHLRGPDFFNVKQFPKITFATTRVEATKDGLELHGKLTMHGETQEIMIPLTKIGEGDSPFGDYRVGFSSQFNVKRSKFGMTGMLQGIGDDVALTVSFEGVRQ